MLSMRVALCAVILVGLIIRTSQNEKKCILRNFLSLKKQCTAFCGSEIPSSKRNPWIKFRENYENIFLLDLICPKNKLLKHKNSFLEYLY